MSYDPSTHSTSPANSVSPASSTVGHARAVVAVDGHGGLLETIDGFAGVLNRVDATTMTKDYAANAKQPLTIRRPRPDPRQPEQPPGRLPHELNRLRRYGLIIIDEVAYLPFSGWGTVFDGQTPAELFNASLASTPLSVATMTRT